MPEIIFESNKGVVFEKTVYKNGRCRLAVRDKERGRVHMSYRYTDAPGFSSPYLNWDNLNCCDGWEYDKTYLYTAVQRGKKLFADIVFDMFDEDYAEQVKAHHSLPVERDAVEIIERLKEELPPGCVMGSGGSDIQRNKSRLRNIYICRDGTIADCIDAGEVFDAYGRFGIAINGDIQDKILKVCDVPLTDFIVSNPARGVHDIYNPRYPSQLIISGLLFGYPIETTAALIERDFPPVVRQ